MEPTPDARCPCLSGETYGNCCQPFHSGASEAPTALRLMRSRYSAFVTLDVGHLLRTWSPATRPASLDLDPSLRWFGLEIIGTTAGTLLDSEGTVEFVARYRTEHGAESQHEVSRFERLSKRWFYLDSL